MLEISNTVSIPEKEISFSAIRAQGAGGQNVNKVSTAVHLRFDIQASSLPDFYKTRLLGAKDKRINADGVVVIKSQQFRSQEKNREAALDRLIELIRSVSTVRKARKPTRPSASSRKKRLDDKKRRGHLKTQRSNADLE